MTRKSSEIRIAIVGVGNCASALVQGLTYYQNHADIPEGVMQPRIGPYAPSDIRVVAAFDIDARKVGRPLAEAIFAPPNCALVFQPTLRDPGPTVMMGPVLDGCAPHMAEWPDDQAFRVATAEPVDIVTVLRESGAEILVNYLPVGSERAARRYAEACLDAGVALVNCIPVFLASDPAWAERFRAAGLPIIGDDVKSQFGATILHRTVVELMRRRGCTLRHTYQINTGGNTDFLNMLARDRLASKKKSKTNSVQSQLATPLPARDIHIGPSDYVPWQNDNKVAFVRVEGTGFGGVPMDLEMRLSVQDSPNSAGVVVDAVRCVRLGLDRGLAGPLLAPCAALMKSPPTQTTDPAAQAALDEFLNQSRS
jgi:myo-inositol-1-phosphate synthase